MKELLKSALKDAMRAKDPLKLAVIRGVLSEIQYDEMQKGNSEATASEVTGIIQRELKKRKEEIEFAEKADRPEAKEKLFLEVQILEGFLPKQLTSEELKAFFENLKTSDSSINRGSAMKTLKDTHSGSYDGKLASTIAQEIFG